MRRVLLGGLLLLGLLGAAVVWLPAPLLRLGLGLAGIEVELGTVAIGLDALELRAVTIGRPPVQRLARLGLRYRPLDLFRGRLEAVEIDGLEVAATLTDGDFRLAGLDGPDAAGGGIGPLPQVGRITVRRSRLRLDTALGPVALPFDLELQAVGGQVSFELTIDDARLGSPWGRLRAGLTLAGQLPLAWPPAAETIAAEGSLTIAADEGRLPGLIEAIQARGAVTLRLAQGRLEATSTDLELAGSPATAGSTWLATQLPPPWRLAVAAGGPPLRLLARPAAAGVQLALSADLQATTGGPAAWLALTTAADLDPAGGVRRLAASHARLVVEGLRLGGLALTTARLDLQASGRGDDLVGAIDLAAEGRGTPVEGLTIGSLSLQQRGQLRLAGGDLTVHAAAPGSLELREVAWPGGWRTERLGLELLATPEPWLVARIEDGQPGAWHHAGQARLVAVDLSSPDPTTASAEPPLRVIANDATLRLDAAGEGGDLLSAGVRVEEAAVEVTPHRLRLDGLAASVAWPETTSVWTIPIAIARIAHGGQPAWFAPLALTGSATSTGARIAFDLGLRQSRSGAVLTLHGDHDRATGGGRAALAVAPLTFVAGGLQPRHLVPVLGRRVEDVAGRLTVDGGLDWHQGGLGAVDLAVLVEGLGLAAGPARLEQINGVVRLSGLLPPVTPPGQQLAIGLLDLGLPLTDGLIQFQLRPAGLAVERLDWRFASGQVHADPFSLGSELAGSTVRLQAEGLDLGALLDLTRLDGLSGAGTIDGVLPVELGTTAATIAGGRLAARAPGWLRYRSAAVPAALQGGDAGVTLLLQALENFRYDQLEITLDGATDANMVVGLSVRGANPDLHDGHPIELDVDLEGELAGILERSLSGYRVPRQIEDAMARFAR